MVLAAVRQYGGALRYASDEIRSDKEFFLAAVRHSDLALQYASKELRSDKEVVLEAVRHSNLALGYASGKLRDDKEVVLVSIDRDYRTFMYVSERLKQDKDVVLKTVLSGCSWEDSTYGSFDWKFRGNKNLKAISEFVGEGVFPKIKEVDLEDKLYGEDMIGLLTLNEIRNGKDVKIDSETLAKGEAIFEAARKAHMKRQGIESQKAGIDPIGS